MPISRPSSSPREQRRRGSLEQGRGRKRGEHQRRPEASASGRRAWPARRSPRSMPRKRELVEHAVGPVRLDQPVDRQQRRGQRRHPQGAAADPREQRRVRARPRTGTGSRPAGRRSTGSHAAAGQPAAQLAERSARRSSPSASSLPVAGRAAGARRRGPRRRPRGGRRSASPSRVDAVGVEAVERLVEQPQRRARGDHPRQRRALALAGRQHPHRHVARDGSRPIASIAWPRRRRPRPEAPAPGQRQLAVERQAVVGQRRRARARRVPAAGRSSPAARRIRLDLPLPLGPVTMQAPRPARARGRALRTAAARRARSATAREPSAARFTRCVLERVHVGVGEAEMVADLVDHDVGTRCSRCPRRLGPFVEDRRGGRGGSVGRSPTCSTLRSCSGTPS